MKSMKTSGIILGRTRGANRIRETEMSVMTLTFGGLSVFVRPALAISPTQQQSAISTEPYTSILILLMPTTIEVRHALN